MIAKMQNFLKILMLILFVVARISTVLCDCNILFNDNSAIKPHFSKQIGSRYVKLSNENNYIKLQDNEEVVGYCDVEFESPPNFKGKRELHIKCEYSDIRIGVNRFAGYSGNYNRDVLFQCGSLKWNLYELSEPLVWCPVKMASYMLARPIQVIRPYGKLAGICYDTDNMSLSSMYYTIAPRHLKDLYPHALSHYKPNVKIEYVKETFAIKRITSDIYDNQQFKEWIYFSNYQYNSTVQNPILYNEIYKEFGSLLDFVWWPSLQFGNWKRYEEAMARYIENGNESFDVLAGISGTVQAPVKEICQNNYTMKDFIDNTNSKIPLYVWNYLQPRRSSHNTSDGVVIIGFNSPFYEFYSENDVVFCQDICKDIEWLKNVRTSFRYSAMGVIFCCSVDEVKTSKVLTGFPEYVHKPKPNTTTTPLPLPFTYEQQSEDNDEDEIPNYKY